MDVGLKPLGDRVLIERTEKKEDKTPGGLIIPETAKEKPTRGKVLAVGPGKRDENGERIPVDVKKGDIVLFGKWGGKEVKIRGKEYLLMKEEDIFGIIE